MSRKGSKYRRATFESKRPGNSGIEPYAAIYATMMNHPSYIDLSGNAVKLYSYMKLQQFGSRKDGLPEGQFYFNQAKWKKTYKLYKSPNSFYRDRNALISHGFIEIVENNRFAREKNVYRFSDKWQQWTPGTDYLKNPGETKK